MNPELHGREMRERESVDLTDILQGGDRMCGGVMRVSVALDDIIGGGDGGKMSGGDDRNRRRERPKDIDTRRHTHTPDIHRSSSVRHTPLSKGSVKLSGSSRSVVSAEKVRRRSKVQETCSPSRGRDKDNSAMKRPQTARARYVTDKSERESSSSTVNTPASDGGWKAMRRDFMHQRAAGVKAVLAKKLTHYKLSDPPPVDTTCMDLPCSPAITSTHTTHPPLPVAANMINVSFTLGALHVTSSSHRDCSVKLTCILRPSRSLYFIDCNYAMSLTFVITNDMRAYLSSPCLIQVSAFIVPKGSGVDLVQPVVKLEGREMTDTVCASVRLTKENK